MHRGRIPLQAALALVGAVALIAGCTAAEPTQNSPNRPATGLERFMDQELDYGPCDPAVADPVPKITTEVAKTATCAMLDVPLDYEKPYGQTIEVAVLRIPATGKDKIGSIVVNPGGPGIPGTTHAPLQAALWAVSPIAERFDVVGFDPRGVGQSRPALDCYSDEQREADVYGQAIGGGGGWTAAKAREAAKLCAAGSGGEQMLAHVGTRDVARDLDVLRAVLGDDQLTFVGASYGTRLGAVYAEMFPDNVRALVLDGGIDPLKQTPERMVQMATGLQRSFVKVAEFCASKADCPLGNDPARATAVAQKMLQPLVKKPIPTADGRELTFNSATEAIISALYSPVTWPTVVAAFADLRDGRGDKILALRDTYYGRSASGKYANNVEAVFAINCMDEQRLTPEQTTKVLRDFNVAAPFQDPGVAIETHYGCEAWPAEPTLGIPYATDIQGLPQVLVVSVTGDGFTPHEAGISLAETLGAQLLTVKGEQHGATSGRNPCVDGIVANYLIDLELPGDDASCSL